MNVDLTPIIQAVLGLAAIAITTLGTLAVKRLADWLGVQANSAAVTQLDAALTRAVHAGASEAQDLIREKGWDHVDVKNAIVASGARIVIDKFAPALKSVGLDPADPNGATTKYLTEELSRIFPTAIAPVAASPVTPPVKETR
jgi:hypothetical protein